MSETEDGKILYRLKNCFSDGTTHVLFDPLELVEKAIALIPPTARQFITLLGNLRVQFENQAPNYSSSPKRKERKIP